MLFLFCFSHIVLKKSLLPTNEFKDLDGSVVNEFLIKDGKKTVDKKIQQNMKTWKQLQLVKL